MSLLGRFRMIIGHAHSFDVYARRTDVAQQMQDADSRAGYSGHGNPPAVSPPVLGYYACKCGAIEPGAHGSP
jgi:hypothetical protein